jgi:hypothetical protein
LAGGGGCDIVIGVRCGGTSVVHDGVAWVNSGVVGGKEKKKKWWKF